MEELSQAGSAPLVESVCSVKWDAEVREIAPNRYPQRSRDMIGGHIASGVAFTDLNSLLPPLKHNIGMQTLLYALTGLLQQCDASKS